MTAVNARIMQEAIARANIREVAGAKSNPVIVQWIRAMLPRFRGSDATAWCSAFVFEVCSSAGADIDEDVNVAARSWRKAGRLISLNHAQQGDIVILSRPGGASWQGHVGFYCHHDSRRITLLGGNQNNRVCFRSYPVGRLVQVRRLSGLECVAAP